MKHVYTYYIVLAVIVAFVGLLFTVNTFFYTLNFDVVQEIECEPETESCFVWRCDPSSADEGCTGIPEQDVEYYKYVKTKARYIPECDIANKESCPDLECRQSDKNCSVRYCKSEKDSECDPFE